MFRFILALAAIVIGIALAHWREPGVGLRRLTLDGGVPALRFYPLADSAGPVVVLAHGVTGCKENLYRLAEALAAAGFDCYAVDLPGHGASPLPFRFGKMPAILGRAIQRVGPAEVFVGHSMGSYVGAGAVREGFLNPKLFIAVGALPRFGTNRPPLLLLAGRIEEAVAPARLKAATDARLILFPGCDHALEPFDPRLVRATVEAACSATGRTPPTAWPTRWLGRLAGWFLAMAGAVALAWMLPPLPAKHAWARGALVGLWFIAVMALSCGSWASLMPQPHRLPQQLAMIAVAWGALWVAAKLRLPRWSFAAGAFVLGLLCTAFGLPFPALILIIVALIFAGGAIAGRIAARRGSARDGDFAAALVVGYTLGQLWPVLY